MKTEISQSKLSVPYDKIRKPKLHLVSLVMRRSVCELFYFLQNNGTLNNFFLKTRGRRMGWGGVWDVGGGGVECKLEPPHFP